MPRRRQEIGKGSMGPRTRPFEWSIQISRQFLSLAPVICAQVHPDFSEAPFVEAILGPGDMLFIPKKWWHYVRSLTTSISVNFWF